MATANDAMVTSGKHKDIFKVISLQKFLILTYQRLIFPKWWAAVKAMGLYGKTMDSSALHLSPFLIKTEEPDFRLSDKMRKMENYFRMIKM